MIDTTLKVIGVIFSVFAVLIWYQPATLLRMAERWERISNWVVLQMRIRAWSKAASNDTYREARAFHRAQKGAEL